jgi:26S proteasome regulatory subunit T3
MATNRADTLDPALLRPGRLDRKIEFPLPSRREKRLIFQTATSKMNLSPDVDLEDLVSRPDRLSSAEIASICQAAGLQAVRKNRYVILPVDFEEAWKVRSGCINGLRITESNRFLANGQERGRDSRILYVALRKFA